MLFKEIRFKSKFITKEEQGKVIGTLKFREGFYNYWQVFYRGEEVDYMLYTEEQCMTINEDEDYERVKFSKN